MSLWFLLVFVGPVCAYLLWQYMARDMGHE